MPATAVSFPTIRRRATLSAIHRCRRSQSPSTQFPKKRGYLIGLQWPAIQISLHFRAPFLIETVPLILGFDSLRCGRYSEADAQPHNGTYDRKAFLIPKQILDERLIDLELVELEAAQVPDARIAGAESVQRDPDPERMQLIENPGVVIGSFQQNRFGYLQLQPGRR